MKKIIFGRPFCYYSEIVDSQDKSTPEKLSDEENERFDETSRQLWELKQEITKPL
jgi:hypothetical protein